MRPFIWYTVPNGQRADTPFVNTGSTGMFSPQRLDRIFL